ncbi:MAG: hypothetical protein ABSF90_05965 [Syntrophobacteraceae bacterium]
MSDLEMGEAQPFDCDEHESPSGNTDERRRISPYQNSTLRESRPRTRSGVSLRKAGIICSLDAIPDLFMTGGVAVPPTPQPPVENLF